jgi:WD40 repeat protein
MVVLHSGDHFMHSRILAAFALFALPFLVLAQDTPKSQSPSHPPRAVEKRLKAVEKPKADSKIDAVVRALNSARIFEQVAISPNGKSVAWVEAIPSKSGTASGNTAIYISSAGGKTPPHKLSASAGAPRDEGSVTWSPDSKQVAFLSDAASPGQRQLYVANAAGGPARKLTSVKGFLASPKFSPDGKTIAVLFI